MLLRFQTLKGKQAGSVCQYTQRHTHTQGGVLITACYLVATDIERNRATVVPLSLFFLSHTHTQTDTQINFDCFSHTLSTHVKLMPGRPEEREKISQNNLHLNLHVNMLCKSSPHLVHTQGRFEQ